MSAKMTRSPLKRKRLLFRMFLVCGVIVGWLTLHFVWFDSHSLVRYWAWQEEHEQLVKENAQLQAEIKELQALLETPPSDEMIEKIAREQYGMRREGETIYRVEE